MIRRLFASASIAVVLIAAPASAYARASDAPQAATSEFDRLVDDSKAAMMGDPEAALRHSSRALAVARREGAGVHTATAQWLQGEALLRLNRAADAEPTIRQGLAVVAMRAPNTKLHGDLTRALGAVLATQGQVQPALQNFQAAFRIFGAAKEPRNQAMALQDIGSIYQDAGDYQKVLQYYAQSAELYKGDPSILVAAHNNVGQALKELKKYDEAVAEFRKARTLAKAMESPYLEAWILDNLASTELLAGHIPAAEQDLNEGLRISQADSGAREWQPFLWGVAAQIAQKRGQPAQAAQLIERTFAGKDVATTELPFREFHRTAYEVYSTLGDEHRALVHLKAYKRLDDEVRALAASTNAALMAAQFDFANQASRIAQLKAGQLQRDIALARTRNTITGLLLLGSVFVTALMAVAFAWIRRSRNEVRAANGMLNVANEALEKALAARTEFLATTSHEIRTPLNGILGMTQVILRDPSLDPALRDKIAVVHGSGETMRALVDDILDVAKIETGKLEISRAEMNLAELFAEAAQLWTARASAKGLQLVLDVADAPETIVEDATRLRQVLFNLMSNAIKFTKQGSVTLTAKVESLEEGEQLLLRVTDTGIGIPQDRLGEIFESFSQVDGSITRLYGGTGLGLTICRSLAVAMGGGITVESVLGQGSTFEVRLPLVRSEAPAAPGPAVALAERFEDCRLVLADPNPLSQAVIRAVLQPKLQAVEAVNTAEALIATGPFDLALVDAGVLGDDVAGRFQAARDLAAAIAPTPLVVMAANLTDEDAMALIGAGVAQLIKKPIAAPALIGELVVGFEARRRVDADSKSFVTG